MNVTSLMIDECEDTECERCHEVQDTVVSLSVDTEHGTAVIFLCQSCIADAVGAAVEDGLATEMILAK